MLLSWRFVLLVAVAAIPLSIFPSWATGILLVAVLIAVAVTDIALAAPVKLITVERRLPASVRAGGAAELTLLVRNTAIRTWRGYVRDGWQPSAQLDPPQRSASLAAGEGTRLRFTLAPTRRGELRSKVLTIRSMGPLRLAGRQRSRESKAGILVLPPFHSQRHLPSKLAQLRELDGQSAVQIRGAGTEFDSLRDYVQGDDVRSIDWRATARHQCVVVRTWRPERDRRVVILLDSSRSSAARIGDEPRLDTGIESALLLAALAGHGGDKVDVLAYDRRVRAWASSSSRGGMIAATANALAAVSPELIEMDWAGVPALIRQATARRALVVLLTALDAGAAEENLLPAVAALATRHVVVVASVADPQVTAMGSGLADSSAVYAAAAAARSQQERANIADLLRHAGASVVDAGPADLPPALADEYLALKAAGRL